MFALKLQQKKDREAKFSILLLFGSKVFVVPQMRQSFAKATGVIAAAAKLLGGAAVGEAVVDRTGALAA